MPSHYHDDEYKGSEHATDVFRAPKKEKTAGQKLEESGEFMPDPEQEDLSQQVNYSTMEENYARERKPGFDKEMEAIGKADRAGNLTDQERIEAHKRAKRIRDAEDEIDPETGWPMYLARGAWWLMQKVGEGFDWVDKQAGIPGTDIDVYHARRKILDPLSETHLALGILGEIFLPDSIDIATAGFSYIPNRFRKAGKAGIKLWAKLQKAGKTTDDINIAKKGAEKFANFQGKDVEKVWQEEGLMMAIKPDPDNIPPLTRHSLPKDNQFHQLVMSLDQEGPYKLTPPGKFVSKTEDTIPEISKLQELTTQEIESLGSGFKTYMGKRPYKDAATPAGMERMQKEVNSTFEQLLGPDFDQDLVRGYMKAVADHEGALLKLQEILNDTTGKLWDRQHATALRNLEHSGRMLGNKGLFPAFNFPDVLDQTAIGRSKKKIIREGNRPDRTARGADFQRTLARVLGKPLSLEESILYWYDQDMFYFWKELSPLQRQQLVDSSRTLSGGRIKSELTVAENINKALESMKFGEETMSGKLGRKLNPQERLEALVSQAQAELLKKRKYKNTDLKSSPRQGNVFYDIKTGIETDYRPDLTGKGAYWDIESE